MGVAASVEAAAAEWVGVGSVAVVMATARRGEAGWEVVARATVERETVDGLAREVVGGFPGGR